MTLTTKYNIGDIVYILRRYQIKQMCIVGVIVRHDNSDDGDLTSYLGYCPNEYEGEGSYSEDINEDKCFGSAEEILNYLKSNIVKFNDENNPR